MKTISLQAILSALDEGRPPTFVEALPKQYFDQGHLPRALNINVGEVKDKAPTALPDKRAPIVVYCASASCTNSDQVALQLTALGYTDVAVFKGGKAQWQEQGRALEAA
jgi:rhodanese-related sulfurtransferase